MKRWYWILGSGLVLLGFATFFLALIVVLGDQTSSTFTLRPGLAVIEVEGAIFESKDIIDQIDRVLENDDIQGVLLRIDSPGGAVGPSQEIYEGILRLKKKKKVVASLGSVAASGGYYIAVAADKIIANPGTITGSIGVLMDYTNVEELLKFLKVDAEVLTAGKLKDLGSPLRPMTPEDREVLKGVLDDMHAQFKEAVRQGRGLSQEEIDRIADGRVYTGRQALALNLVDQLGNQQVAVDEAKKLLKLQKDPILLYPKKKKMDMMNFLLSSELENKFLKTYYSLQKGKMLYLSKGI